MFEFLRKKKPEIKFDEKLVKGAGENDIFVVTMSPHSTKENAKETLDVLKELREGMNAQFQILILPSGVKADLCNVKKN